VLKLSIGLVAAAAALFGAMSFSAPAQATEPNGNGPDEKVTICHLTGSETNPVEIIEISANAVEQHIANHGDSTNIRRCKKLDDKITTEDNGVIKVLVCHRTESEKNPVVIIEVPLQALEAHFLNHADGLAIPIKNKVICLFPKG
jgi:hypothetical protein